MNVTLRSLFGILTLVGLFCVPMNFPGALERADRIYMVAGPPLLLTLLVMSVFTWRAKSCSIIKSFIFGFFCALILSFIFPFGFVFYAIMTNVMESFFTKTETTLLMAICWIVISGLGGLIGITLAISFSQPKQKGSNKKDHSKNPNATKPAAKNETSKSLPPTAPHATNPIANQFERPILLSCWSVGAGLVLMAISTLFEWVKFDFGGAGESWGNGDRKIILGISIALIASFAIVLIRRFWLTRTLFVIQAWGIVVLFWMGGCIFKIRSLSSTMQEKYLEGTMFASEPVISPGTGLYLGLLGGVVTACAAGYFLIKLDLSPQRLRLFYASLVMSIFVGVILAFALGST